jgi:diguanylate cyclase (GGDEF)-like protein/PAS domain S-box-containing protein
MDKSGNKAERNGQRPHDRKPALLMLFALAAITLLVVWGELTIYDAKVGHQRQLAQQSVAVVAGEIEYHLSQLRHINRLLLDDKQAAFRQLAANPDNTELHRDLTALLRGYHADFVAFTVADANGNVIYDDFGERIGPMCHQDIRSFATNNTHDRMHLHPGPAAYHIDVMQPWRLDDGAPGVFFASYQADSIVRLLRQGQVVDHQLLLVRRDDRSLIEATAEGARDVLQRAHRLDPKELSLIEQYGAETSVEGSNWLLVDKPDPGLFESQRHTGLLRGTGIITGALLLGVVSLRRVTQEAERREQAERALRGAHATLERKVAERTQALSRSNSQLAAQMARRKQAEQRMSMLSQAVVHTGDTIIISDPSGRIQYANPAFERLTGQSATQLLGRPLAELQSAHAPAEFLERVADHLQTQNAFREVFCVLNAQGNSCYTEQTITAVRDAEGRLRHLVATGKDITERMDNQRRLAYLAHHDTLTELPNRVLMFDRLDHALARAERKHGMVALLFMDIDRFKTINDSLGHQAGDELLKAVANRLRYSIRRSDSIARLGGDEFVAILEDVEDADEPAHVARTVLAAIAQPLSLAGQEVRVSSSMGITLYPTDATDGNTLLQYADVAMYRAKAEGGNTYNYYTADMTAEAQRRLSLENRLRNALANREFHLVYQPRHDLASGRITSIEALLRWQPSGEGVMSPAHFVPVLEETGLIREVGQWVLQQTCRDFDRLRTAGHQLRIACNLSAKQFQDEALVEIIDDTLAECEMSHRDLELEITESLLVRDIDHAARLLNALHERGVRISVDDFGTGYSSMSYLKRFPIDDLKIDQSFIHELNEDRDDAAIVAAIIAMARSLGLGVVAEGVETQAQLHTLRLLGCDEVQGMWIAAPLPLNDLLDWLAMYPRATA